MIFTRTCDNTRKMALMLRNLGFDAIPIHGQMAQPKRIGALNKFKAGERSILVATGMCFEVVQPTAFTEQNLFNPHACTPFLCTIEHHA